MVRRIIAGCIAAMSLAHGQAYRDNETLYSNQDPDTETRRSDHFRICFGHYNRDTGTPVTEQLVQGNLQMFEQMWHRWVVEMGLHDINESATSPDGNKYRANFHMLMTWNDGGGGGAYSSMDANGFFYAMANSGYARFDPPSGATPHEFGHVWEGSAAGFNGTDSSGAWWECMANWMQLQFLNSYPQAGGYLANGMYYPCHGRDYYDSFMIWETAREDPRYGAPWVNSIWSNATPEQQAKEFILDRMIRLDSSGSPDKAGAMKDLWGDMARKMVTWDFERQRWLATANRPDDGSDWEFYQRCRTPLVKVPGTTGPNWYRPVRGHLPMQFGFNIIPLQVVPGTTVSCHFAPHCDPVRQSDWRACLVAVDSGGGAAYSSLWNAGSNSITLSADQSKLYLVVIATPKPMKIPEPVWQAYRSDAGLQFPYAVSFTNAGPKNVIYPVQSRTGMVQHANGGGWKSTSASVDASAYVGPNAQVLDTAQVRGNARLEDYAVVRNNAKVRDNAVVSGHAEVKDNAQVYGNAKVRDWARVFGHAEVYENARVIEHGNCGDGDATTHTKVYGNAIVKGTTYVYNTTTINGGLIMEGDSANGNGTAPASKGVHFGWSWGTDAGRFDNLADNGFLFARHSFERDNAVFAMDEFGINHGFLLGACRTGKDSGASVRGGRVLMLNGIDQGVELHNGVNDSKEGTYSLWFKISATGLDQRLWSFGDGSAKVMELTCNAGGSGRLRFTITDGGSTHVLDGPVIPTDVWKHAAVVFEGTTCTLYVDGVPVAGDPNVGVFPDRLNAPLMENANFLGRGNGGDWFGGALDDFRCFTRALSAAEILAMFNEASPAPVTIAADSTAPTPNAATWLVAPVALGDSAATMSASPGSDESGWVEYYFTCVSGGGHDSGWVSFNKYTDVGIAPGSAPTYTVKMRDRNGNTTAQSTPASVSLETSSPGTASFSYGPIGIANGQITMAAGKLVNASGKVEYKFDRTAPTVASSGWQSSSVWTNTGLATGSTCTYTVTIRDGRGNTSASSAPASAVARDDAAPALPIPVAHWQMLPYATIDNRISMTAQAASDPSGVEYQFHCVSGGGPDSSWQSSATYVTPVLPDGSYVYQYKVRDKSARANESAYSTAYPAIITRTTGYHNYTLDQVLTGTDDWLVSFPATVMKVNADHYVVKDLATGSTIKVKPNTYGLVTDGALALKNVTVKGHLYTFAGSRVVTYSTITGTGNPALYTISGRVTNSAGAGIAGATVSFSDVANASVDPIVTATTDANGNFSKGLTTGTWHVAAGHSAYNTSADQVVAVNAANVSGVNFTLVANASVAGRVVQAGDGAPLAGASVYFSRSPGASGSAVFTATTDANGNFSQAVQDGVWYVAAGASEHYTSADKTITVGGITVGGIGFALKSSIRNIPQAADLLFSAVTESLPASGAAGAWPTYLPSGQNLTPMGSPGVLIANGVKWVDHAYADGDGFLQSTSATAIPVNGATIVVAAKPRRNSIGTSWTSIVDVFYNRLVLGIRNSTGRIDVCRNGSWASSATAIPDGQVTILSLVVQPDGKYKVFANGAQVINNTSTSDMYTLEPNVAGPYANAINVGRNNPDGWTTFNGAIGDVFVYKIALADAQRQQIEADMMGKFLSTDHTITASASIGGVINPSGSVAVVPGGDQTFTITPQPGYLVSDVTVDGLSVGTAGTYTFSDVTGNHTISAIFIPGTNTPPVISTIPAQEIPANSSTGALPFTVDDAQTSAGSLTVSAQSNNTSLVPVSAVVFGGSGGNRTVTVTPTPSMIGSATITLTVSDGITTSSSSFVLNVTTPAGAPSISLIGDQTTEEDQPVAAIGFTLADADTPVNELTVSAVSSDQGVVPDQNIVLGGSGATRNLTITPSANQSGSCFITLTVNDGLFQVTTAFQLTVNPVNDPPVIGNVADLTVAQDSVSAPIALAVSDMESDAAALVVTAKSSNPGLVPEGGVVISGSGSNRTVLVTPVAGKSGSALVTLTVSDGLATASDTFVVHVTPAIVATAVSINVGSNGAIPGGGVAGAVPVANWNNLTGVSNPVGSAGTLVDSTGAAVPGMSVSFQGGANTFNAGSSPNTNLLSGFLSGSPMSATVGGIPYARYDVYVYYNGFFSNHSMTWRLSNVTGSPVVLDTQYSVRGSVSSGNLFVASGDSHVLSQHATLAAADSAAAAGSGGTYLKFTGLSAAAIKIEETSNNGSNENGFTGIQVVNASAGSAPMAGDVPDQVTVENTATAAIPFTISDAETAADALTVTASSSNPGLVPNSNIMIGGNGGNRTVTVNPAADQSGSAVIVLAVSDGTFTTTESFVLTVLFDNQAPTISQVADQVITEDGSSGVLAFSVGDDATAAELLQVSAVSSDVSLVPVTGIVIGGGGSQRTVTLTPAPNQYGSATISLTVSDGSLFASSSFLLVVNPANDVPTVSALADQEMVRNTTLGPLPFTVGDLETPSTALQVTGTSSNPTLVPDASIVISGSGANRALSLTPATGQTGTAMISIHVSDGAATASESFLLTVVLPNTAPTISNVTDRAVYQGTSTGAIPFMVGDAESPAASLVVTASSSNTVLVPVGSIALNGTDGNRTVTVAAADGQTGTATITLTVSDGNLSASDQFVLTVNELPTGQTVTYQAGDGKLTASQYADSWISQGSPAANNGAATTLTLRDSTTNQNIGLVAFFGIFGDGGNQIPVGSVIRSATLRMVNANDRGKKNDIHVIDRPWSESTVTWSNFFADETGYGTYLTTIGSSSGVTGTHTINIKDTMQAWADDPDSNFGLLFRSNGIGSYSDPQQWTSGENATTANRPLLTVSFVPPNRAPSITTAAAAVPAAVTGTSAVLSVAANDDAGEAGLTYAWSASGGAGGRPVLFSENGTNAARTITATFQGAGSYVLSVTVADAGGLTTTSEVSVAVGQTPSAITISPAAATVTAGATADFDATVFDQFGDPLVSAAVDWSVSGGGTIDGSGVFTSATAGGPYVVSAVSDTAGGTAAVTVMQPSYSAWKGAHFTVEEIAAGDAAELADPDHDGFVNLAEYALGADPGAFTRPLVAAKTNEGLVLEFQRPRGLPDVDCVGEASDDMVEWVPCALEVLVDGPVQTLRARDPLVDGDLARRFIRLRFIKR